MKDKSLRLLSINFPTWIAVKQSRSCLFPLWTSSELSHLVSLSLLGKHCCYRKDSQSSLRLLVEAPTLTFWLGWALKESYDLITLNSNSLNTRQFANRLCDHRRFSYCRTSELLTMFSFCTCVFFPPLNPFPNVHGWIKSSKIWICLILDDAAIKKRLSFRGLRKNCYQELRRLKYTPEILNKSISQVCLNVWNNFLYITIILIEEVHSFESVVSNSQRTQGQNFTRLKYMNRSPLING